MQALVDVGIGPATMEGQVVVVVVVTMTMMMVMMNMMMMLLMVMMMMMMVMMIVMNKTMIISVMLTKIMVEAATKIVSFTLARTFVFFSFSILVHRTFGSNAAASLCTG